MAGPACCCPFDRRRQKHGARQHSPSTKPVSAVRLPPDLTWMLTPLALSLSISLSSFCKARRLTLFAAAAGLDALNKALMGEAWLTES